ncbi:MFS transporter [Acetobacter sp. P1H12_c]|uniref:MFS transporter n=1 Tax=Acetobacter sp. P1H12_c TaxID=2762621 RepID=UPI001C0521B2|nr:MFS transporter [Acetobacter sp. P1H12_c]
MDAKRESSSGSGSGLTEADGMRLGYAIALLLFVVGCDLYVVAPLLPGIRESLGVSVSGAGLLVTVFTAGYTIASPLIGSLTDRLGRRAVLYGGLIAFVLFEAVSAWAPDFAILLVARGIAGIAAAAITPTCYTIIGDAVPYGARGRVMSVASVGFSVSSVGGVPLGLWLSEFWNWRGVLWALTAATVAAAGILALALSRLPTLERAPESADHGNAVADARVILAGTGPVLAISFLAFGALGLVYTYLVVDLGSVWHWSSGRIVTILFAYGLANVAGNLTFGRLGDRSGKIRAVRIGQAVEIAALLGLAGASFEHWPWILIAALVIFAFGQAYIPDLKALASSITPELRGRSQAWNNAAMYGGMMVGSWVASHGYPAIGLGGLSAVAAAAVAAGWVVATAARRV